MDTEPVSILKIFFTLFLVLLNGFFVAAEFAIVKVRSSQIEVRTGLNKSLSAAAKSIVNNLDAYLAATQLGITLASLGLGWVGEEVMTHMIRRSMAFFQPRYIRKSSPEYLHSCSFRYYYHPAHCLWRIGAQIAGHTLPY